ncbi:DUF6384 family protein [uncultured Thiodictyon sp.]|uniref:DUF6384 family protein n=1 Tax=uncultured Thiodictyon sp. TaxID=1846217 RepID=UPI0025F647F4|nr:DUF6384 family protein [uncultured Thiodictyon sp.]
MSEPVAIDRAATKPPLDEVMLAMDVVDTLRRRERLATSELDDLGREEDLVARLRKIYADQGLEVPDRVIEQGVAALKEERFTYQPPPDTLGTRLALLYIRRGTWGKWLGGIIAVGVLAVGVGYALWVAPAASIAKDLARVHTQALAAAKTDQARDAIERTFNAGEAALRTGDKGRAKAALGQLQSDLAILAQEYVVRIVSRPGVQSGLFRVPNVNTGARNYYVIVEAVDPAGRVLRLPIANEETRQTSSVDIWGLRVDQPTYEAVKRDKQDDGIIERDRFGYKPRGALVPHYEMTTTGGAITKW